MTQREYVSCADTAKLIREALKKDFPAIKFSVRSHTYSGGASINVEWTDGPTEKEVKETTGKFAGADFDGMQDLKTYHTSIHPHTGKAVHYGADFIFEKRRYSAAFIAPIQAKVCKEWDITDPGVKAESEYLSAGPNDNIYVQKARENLATLVWREAQDISATMARKIARSEGQAITISQNGNTWLIAGDTYPKRRDLKDNGCTWDKVRKVWTYTGDALPQVIQDIVNGTNKEAAAQPSQADHFRQLANHMSKAIEDKMRDGLENTARRARMVESRKSDGRRLKVLQATLYALADAWEAGTLPDCLKGIRSKTQIQSLMSRVYPSSKWGESERKSLAQAGIGSPEAYERASYALTEFVKTEAGEKSRAEIIKEQESELARSRIDGFFPTPEPLVNKMLARAELKPYMRVLEPSAGKGNIADGVREWEPESRIECVEIHYDLRAMLTLKGHNVVGNDFTTFSPAHPYDRILMNPPFEHLQDIDHVRRAFDMLADGGRLVAIMGAGPFFRSDRKSTEFLEWLNEVGGSSEDLGQPFENGERATGVRSYLVVIDKPQSRASYAVILRDSDNPAEPYTPSAGAVASNTPEWTAFPLSHGRRQQLAQVDSGYWPREGINFSAVVGGNWVSSGMGKDHEYPAPGLPETMPQTANQEVVQLSLF